MAVIIYFKNQNILTVYNQNKVRLYRQIGTKRYITVHRHEAINQAVQNPTDIQNGLVSNKRFRIESYFFFLIFFKFKYFILFFVLLREQANLLKITNIVSPESCVRVNTKWKT